MAEKATIKAQLHARCLELVQERLQSLKAVELEVQKAANNETKSSAGDKYETGRAMMHLEKERLAGQMEEVAKLKKALDQVSPVETSGPVAFGSLVSTSGLSYFVAASVGEVAVGDEQFFVISASAPIAKMLMGKSEGDHFELAGKKHIINNVL